MIRNGRKMVVFEVTIRLGESDFSLITYLTYLTLNIDYIFQVMRKPHTLNAAETSRESFSKAIYDRLFTWIVGHVNSAIDPALTGILQSTQWDFLTIFLSDSQIFYSL